MTLGEGKRRVLMLLDECSGGRTLTLNEDLSVRMNECFNMAQKDVAAWQTLMPLNKIKPITAETGDDYEFEVSEDAANCLPLFVAMQLIDASEHKRSLYNLYLQMRGMLPHTALRPGDVNWKLYWDGG